MLTCSTTSISTDRLHHRLLRHQSYIIIINLIHFQKKKTYKVTNIECIRAAMSRANKSFANADAKGDRLGLRTAADGQRLRARLVVSTHVGGTREVSSPRETTHAHARARTPL